MMLTKRKHLQKNLGQRDWPHPPFGDVTYMSHWALMVKNQKKFEIRIRSKTELFKLY